MPSRTCSSTPSRLSMALATTDRSYGANPVLGRAYGECMWSLWRLYEISVLSSRSFTAIIDNGDLCARDVLFSRIAFAKALASAAVIVEPSSRCTTRETGLQPRGAGQECGEQVKNSWREGHGRTCT